MSTPNESLYQSTYHGFINRVSGLVWEDASGEAGDTLLHLKRRKEECHNTLKGRQSLTSNDECIHLQVCTMHLGDFQCALCRFCTSRTGNGQGEVGGISHSENMTATVLL